MSPNFSPVDRGCGLLRQLSVVGLALLLGACQTMGGGRSSVEPPVSSQDYQRKSRHYEKTIAQGAVVGGVLGYAGAELAGAGGKETLAATLGGALLGGVIGKAAADRAESLAVDRDAIEKTLAESQANRLEAARLLDATGQNIAYLNRKIADLEAQHQRGAISEAQFRTDIATARGHVEQMNKSVARIQEQVGVQQNLLGELRRQVDDSSDRDVRATLAQVADENERIEGLVALTSQTSVQLQRLDDQLRPFGS